MIWMLASQHLPQYDAKAVDICLGGDVPTIKQLGCHPCWCTLDPPIRLVSARLGLVSHLAGLMSARGRYFLDLAMTVVSPVHQH